MSHDKGLPEPQNQQEEKPEIFAVSREENEMKFNRRDFLRVSATVAAGVAATAATGAVLAEGGTALNLVSTSTRTPTATLSLTPGEPCTVLTDKKGINIHVGPGRHRGIRDYLPVDQEFPVIGKAKDPNGLYWWQIELQDIEQAWVHPDDVVTHGDCSQVIDVNAPPFVPANTATPASTATSVPTGSVGSVPPGQTGINYTGSDGRTYTLPCGSPIPAGAVCICNCVSVPNACACDGVCACDGYCSCAGQSHYWYPN